jgi:hypothetical protein
MIIWSGLGFLVAIITFGFSLIAELAARALFKDPTYYQTHKWPLAIALALAAVSVWFLGRYLHGRPAKTLIDPETKREVVLGRRHTLFFIKMEYWGPILLAIALVALIR